MTFFQHRSEERGEVGGEDGQVAAYMQSFEGGSSGFYLA